MFVQPSYLNFRRESLTKSAKEIQNELNTHEHFAAIIVRVFDTPISGTSSKESRIEQNHLEVELEATAAPLPDTGGRNL